MSTIFADKFKNTSGGNNVKVNQLSGIDTAGSITVQGEGTNTTNLQQGLHKHWGTFGMDDGAIDDSFNMTSTTDIAGGQYNVNITTAMANTNFAVDFMPLYVNGNGTSIVKYNNTGLTNGVTTTAAGLYTWRTDTGATVDPTFVHSFIVGDLA
jgi:hypothetical protein